MPEASPTVAALMTGQIDTLAEAIVDRQYRREPEKWARYGPEGRTKSVRDQVFHLQYLAEAVRAGGVTLFVNYIDWARTLFAGLNLPERAIHVALACMAEVLEERLPDDAYPVVSPYLAAAVNHLAEDHRPPASFFTPDNPLKTLAEGYLDRLLDGDRRTATAMIMDAVEGGLSVKAIYLNVFQPCQYEIGRLWQTNGISVAQEHFCTAATQATMALLYPRIFSEARVGRRLVATCIGGELHEIGIRMVADFFEMAGWDTYYLGANTPTDSILQTITAQGADVLGISATMTYHVKQVAEIVARARGACDDRLVIMVGGYPFRLSPDLWRNVGADGDAGTAEAAVERANALVATRKGGDQ